MKLSRWILTISLMLAAAAATAQPPGTADGPARSSAGDTRAPEMAPRTSKIPRFDQFTILLDRNIFDPNRRYDGPPPVVAVTSAPLAIEKIALQGIFINEGAEAVAIFEGTSAQYSTAVALGGIIVGHRIDEILTDKVVLGFQEKKMDLPIAARLILNHQTKLWEITTDTTPLFASAAPPMLSTPSTPSTSERDRGGDRSGDRSSDRNSRSSRYSGYSRGSSRESGPSPPPAAALAVGGVSAEELMRQMMERRRKETGR